ncbi:MarR family transcriptional regulator [Neobacillus sp. PS3-12]|jgi:DNA-binding MarR family transcriptional regulator|uniref:MarR family winged helix-turn-helix transcriptional regulator n=1 Tax=Neobacillus sp. PS3-12 TaxID=3070677 RepID=UPI0027E1F462|nr:MarR family transcriptional regulator [Neobacillus sp. PS3-12]WML52629.1 MarR family transcriptional regulator [Neobacillus sp. PS3-12]
MENKDLLHSFVMNMQTINRYLRSMGTNQLENPVTRVQWLLLRHLQRNGSCTIGELAEHLDVRSSTMSQMVDRLEKNGIVYRSAGQKDARVKTVALSEKGKEIIQDREMLWVDSLAQPFQNFSTEEKETLLNLMDKLVSHIPKKRDNQ